MPRPAMMNQTWSWKIVILDMAMLAASLVLAAVLVGCAAGQQSANGNGATGDSVTRQNSEPELQETPFSRQCRVPCSAVPGPGCC